MERVRADLETIDIDKLEAGAELDVLVAIEIMGWSMPDSLMYFPLMAKDPQGRPAGVPPYSRDITAAWELVARHPHYFILIRSNENRYNPRLMPGPMLWHCNFYAPQNFTCWAETAPHAICLAALKAEVSQRHSRARQEEFEKELSANGY